MRAALKSGEDQFFKQLQKYITRGEARTYLGLNPIEDSDRGTRMSTTPGDSAKPEKEKPTLEEVLKYGRTVTASYLRDYASKLPVEHREDIHQEAAARLIRVYDQLDPALGIKSFCQMHCRGAVLDYIRGGHGFEEAGGSKPKPKMEDPPPNENYDPNQATPKPEEKAPLLETPRLRFRTEVVSSDGDTLDVEEVAGLFGIFAGGEESVLQPNWPLLSRLAGKNRDVHLVCKVLLGFDQEEIAAQFDKGITRERLSQRLYEFFEGLDSPLTFGHRETEQIIYALGLCEYFHMPEKDNGFGWELEPFDLTKEDSFERALTFYEPCLEGVRDQRLKRSDLFGKYKVQPKTEAMIENTEEEQAVFDLDVH